MVDQLISLFNFSVFDGPTIRVRNILCLRAISTLFMYSGYNMSYR